MRSNRHARDGRSHGDDAARSDGLSAERCSYCIIPSTRGSSRSRALSGVLSDVRRAIDAGYKEIVLTGVHLGSYGRDLEKTVIARRARARPRGSRGRRAVSRQLSRADGLYAGARRPGRVVIAPGAPFSSAAYSTDLTRCSPRCVDRTRGVRRALVTRIRALMPQASIGSDIIVGFPGETVAHFERDATTRESIAAVASARVSVLGRRARTRPSCPVR